MSGSPWSGDGADGRRSPAKTHRIIEVVTVLLLAAASVGSAWSAFQVSQWNGIETDEARASGAFRIEASREYALATQIVAYDASSVTQYAEAVGADNTDLQLFLRQTIVRPGFLPILEKWQQQIDAGELPTNLLQDEEYLTDLFATSEAADVGALESSALSEEAGDTADDYIRLTLFFATALFFAGITASFKSRFPRILLLVSAGVTLAVASSLMSTYPIA